MADDKKTILHNMDEIRVPIVIDVVHTFCIYSGLKLNKSKTEGLPLGTLPHIVPTTTHVITFHSVTHAHALGKRNWKTQLGKH